MSAPECVLAWLLGCAEFIAVLAVRLSERTRVPMGWAARLLRDASLRRRRCATHTVARGTRAELGCAALPRRPAESSPRAFLGTTDSGVVPGLLGSLVSSVAHSVAGS